MPFRDAVPADTHATPPLPGLSPIEGKPIFARFDIGALSSDGGLLVLPEIAEGLSIARRSAACADDGQGQIARLNARSAAIVSIMRASAGAVASSTAA